MKASRWARVEKAVVLLWILIVAAVTIAKTMAIARIHGQDFPAYYQAGRRFLNGESPYMAGDFKAYKYAPTLLLFFAPFALFPIDVSLWIFATLNFLVLASMPLLALRLVQRDVRVRPSAEERVYAILLGLVASLRFVDGEVYNAQVNAIAFALVLGAAALWTRPQAPKEGEPRQLAWGGALYSLGAFFKFHPFLGWGVFLKRGRKKTPILLALCALSLAMLPDPRLWGALVSQLRSTTPLLKSEGVTYVYQGFYGLFSNFFGLGQTSKLPFLAFAAVAAYFVARVPKFDLFQVGERPADNPASFLCALFALLLVAVTGSPLPWHHTYVIWAALVPVSFVVGTHSERRWLMILSFVMGVSPSGIIHRNLADFLEHRQSIFFLSLALALLLLRQARRLELTRP